MIKGLVTIKIFDDISKTEKLHIVKKPNLVVNSGRTWLLKRAFNITEQQSSWALYWFSVGSGAAAIDNPFNAIAPQQTDTDLFSPVIINPNFPDGGRKKPIETVTIIDDYTANVIITLDFDEADNNLLNEAGIFAAASKNASQINGFILFSHITFPSVFKSNTNRLVFEWVFHF